MSGAMSIGANDGRVLPDCGKAVTFDTAKDIGLLMCFLNDESPGQGRYAPLQDALDGKVQLFWFTWAFVSVVGTRLGDPSVPILIMVDDTGPANVGPRGWDLPPATDHIVVPDSISNDEFREITQQAMDLADGAVMVITADESNMNAWKVWALGRNAEARSGQPEESDDLPAEASRTLH